MTMKPHFIGVDYIFRAFVHDHHGVTWWHLGRRGAREVAECPTSVLAGNEKLSEVA